MEEQQVRRMQLLSPTLARFGSGAPPGGDSKAFNFNSSSACFRAVGRQGDLWEPEQMEELDGVVAVAAGGNYSLALREDGEVRTAYSREEAFPVSVHIVIVM